MKILIACEESQTVCKAFREKGHEAYSNDIQECSGGQLNEQRYKNGMEAKEFFMMFLNSGIPKICVENPVSSKIFNLPKFTQEIQPYQFGHPYTKKTRLWLVNLPGLKHTNILYGDFKTESTKIPGNWFNKGGKERQRNRSKTFPGIAQAMANQWG